MYLLDTHIVLWTLDGSIQKRNRDIYHIIIDTSKVCFISVVSYWEIVIKTALGKLKTHHNFEYKIQELGLAWLNLELPHVVALEGMPHYHRDPFDRVLVAQAKATKMKLLSTDRQITQYLNHETYLT